MVIFGIKGNLWSLTFFVLLSVLSIQDLKAQSVFQGKYIEGEGDVEYLQLLDKAYRMLRPDPELENLSMLYRKDWNGFVEGPTWNAWWIQNSFGPTYTILPFMDKAYNRFVNNSQNLWFSQMGDGVRKDAYGYVAPEGSLCDCARPGWVVFRQGDSRHNIHDWGFGFTAAGIILQAEMLLVNRDLDLIKSNLPLLEMSSDFIDSRRDPENNMFLIGTAGNLLAPSYAGSGKLMENGSYEMAYLAEISVNYSAALQRMIELYRMVSQQDDVEEYSNRLKKVKDGLKHFVTDEGYFVRALEKDGTPHGVYGAEKYGYFDATTNHDAMAFRVVDDKQNKKIYDKINAIPGLRPYKLIIANYPAYDDMYKDDELFSFGTWVNGGHWTTCEARMQLGYYRAGAFEDAKESFSQIFKMAPVFQLDNPLSDFGGRRYQDKLATNCTYDAFGAPGGFLRGLFEYEYLADGLVIYPHIPPGIDKLQQKFPVYFGEKKIYISTQGTGPLTSVLVNGKRLKDFSETSVFLKLDSKEEVIHLSLGLGDENAKKDFKVEERTLQIPADSEFWDIENLISETNEKSKTEEVQNLRKVGTFYSLLKKNELENTYEFRHTNLLMECIQAIGERKKLKQAGMLPEISAEGQLQADQLYVNTAHNLFNGLNDYLKSNAKSANEQERLIASLWFGI